MNQNKLSLNFKSCQSQMFFKIGVFFSYFLITGLEVCNFAQKTPTQVFSCEYCETLKNTCFEEHLRTAASLLLIIKSVTSIGHLFFFKNMTWSFLLRRFVDLLRVYSLLIINKNYSNMFLLLDLQKNRSKVKYCNKGYLLWYQDFDKFRQVAVHYLMSILMISK